MLPPNRILLNFLLNIFSRIFTVVDFPLEPVIAIILEFVNQEANSISLIIGIDDLIFL